MCELKASLNNLLKKDAKWNWSNNCRRMFQDSKGIFFPDLVLSPFDAAAEIVIASDKV